MKPELLSRNDTTRAVRLLMVVALLTFGAVAARAAGPRMTLPGSVTVLENLTTGTVTNLTIPLSDAATNSSVASVSLSATSSNTNLVSDASLVFSGSGASRTLAITPGQYQYGTATITVVAADSQPVSTTNTFTLHVSLVNQPPSYDISISPVLVSEESGAVTDTLFVTNLSAGPPSQSGETWHFVATTASGSPTNALFTALPAVSPTGTLTFTPKVHSYGTNVVTLVMINSGGIANGGVNAYTNSFLIGVVQTNHAPNIPRVSNLTVLENASNTVTVSVSAWDYDQNASNCVLTASSSNTNLETVSVTGTNVSASNTNVVFTLTLTLTTNGYGVVTNQVIATEDGFSTTNSFKLTVTHVNEAPSFSFNTNVVISNMFSSEEETLSVTNIGFLTNLSAGPSDESSQTWKFTLTTAGKQSTNAVFTKSPVISTNGTLTFSPKAHSYGTNLVTVVMKDNGGTANGGVDAYTNSFLLGIAQTNHAPTFNRIANQTMLENETNMTVSITVWDYDQNASNCVLTATSLNTNLETVSVTGTNVGASNTNVVFTVTMALQTNQFGVVTNQLVATENGFSTTNTFKLTITHVNQAPSFAFNTNVVISNMFSSEEETLAVTNIGFLTNLLAGPTNESSQTFRFTVTTATKGSSNAAFTVLPAIATNGTLTYRPKAHSYGTNLVTVVMTDNGGTANHGIDVYTNTFLLTIVQTNHAPNFSTLTNLTVLENQTNITASFNVWDYDQNSSNCTLSATSLATNLDTVSVGTNVSRPSLTNAVFTVTIMLGTNQFGVVTNQLVATEDGFSTTNTFKVTITHVNQAPSFTFNTNVVISNMFSSEEETLAVTNIGFLTNLNAGPINESNQTWNFTVTTATNSTNAAFTKLPAISTNGTLTFDPKAHSYGTNLVTVVMTDNGGTTDHGIDAYTNTFLLAIVQTNHAPSIVSSNITVLENATNFTVTVNVWDYDQDSSNFVLAATSSNTNLETVSVGTNVSLPHSTNAVFTLTMGLGTNLFGAVTNQLVATEGPLSTTNSLVVTVIHVNQPPSFTFDTNVLVSNILVVAENTGVTNIAGFLTNLNAGPINESNQMWSFALSTVTTNASNAKFTTNFTAATNGTLSITGLTNSFGTNTVTVVMTDNGGTANGGINAYTNTFQLQVPQVWYPPTLTGITNKTILENGTTNLTLAFTLYNHLDTNFAVTPVSSDTNLATVVAAVAGSNCTLTFTPVTDQNGSATITVTAVSDSLTNSTNLTLTVTPVNQAPSFNLALTSYTVDQYNVAVTVTGAVTNISPGPTNESSQTVSFIVTNSNSNLFQAGASPAIDASGTLTFTPGDQGGTVTVGVQAKDNGGTSNGGVDISAFQTMTIVMPSNPFQAVTGSYAGLFYDTNTIANASSGYFSLLLASNGTFTGYILGAGDSNTFSGQFDVSNEYASVTASTSTLDLTLDTSTNAVDGSITNSTGGWGGPVLAYHAGYSASSNTSLAGVYLATMPGFEDPTAGPAGDSIFSITISNNGRVSLSGTMADGTAAVQESQISTAGYYPLYVPLYTGGSGGSVIGWLDFTGSLSDSVSTNSTLTWFDITGATSLYPGGFTNQGVLAASLYNSAQANLLGFTSGSLVLSGGNLATNLTNAVTIANNLITVTAPTNGLTLTINSSTGEIQGSFVDPSDSHTNALHAAILQDTNIAPGYFIGTSEGGSFLLIGN